MEKHRCVIARFSDDASKKKHYIHLMGGSVSIRFVKIDLSHR